jgi:hypothetical protein
MTTRSEQLREAFAVRLGRVRGNMTDSEFANLVADMVSTAQRLEEIEARELGRKTPIPGTIPVSKEPEIRA